MWGCRTVCSVVLLICIALPQLQPHVDGGDRFGSADVADQIDRLLEQELGLRDGNTAPRIDDQAFARRAYLDLVGKLPTPEEVVSFTQSSRPEKRTELVQRLLDDSGFGTNWGNYWRDVVLYRRVDDRGMIAARPLARFFSESLNANRTWDQIAADLIMAEGDIRENGQAGLIMAQLGEPEETVAEISRIFLGIQIQCAQCHDHKTDRWTREQFHELAAFFPRVAVRPTREMPRSFVVVAQDQFPRRRMSDGNNRYAGTAEHYMPNLEDPEARGTRMTPRFFVNGMSVPVGASDQQRRSALAQWVTAPDNPWFSQALVNRIWAELVGEGFYEPVDDLGPDRTPTAPKTVEFLASQFVESQYNMKWLIATIMSTDAYQRQSGPRRSVEVPAFAANCAQPLRGDQLYDAVVHALGVDEDRVTRFRWGGGPGPYGRDPRGQFNVLFGYDPSETRSEVQYSIPQALALMNSERVQQLISGRSGTLSRMISGATNDMEAVQQIYLRVLSRQPTDSEIKTCLSHIQSADNRRSGFEDVVWALLNSAEFIHRK